MNLYKINLVLYRVKFFLFVCICVPQRFSQVQKANIGSGSGDQPALQSCVKVRGKGRLSTVCSTDQFMDVLDSIRECDQEVSTQFTTCPNYANKISLSGPKRCQPDRKPELGWGRKWLADLSDVRKQHPGGHGTGDASQHSLPWTNCRSRKMLCRFARDPYQIAVGSVQASKRADLLAAAVGRRLPIGKGVPSPRAGLLPFWNLKCAQREEFVQWHSKVGLVAERGARAAEKYICSF